MPTKPKPPVGGFDSVWLLAVKFHVTKHPTHFLIDQVKFPGSSANTTTPGNARRWSDPSGPRQFLRRHPALRRSYKPFKIVGALEMPPANSKSKRKS